MEICNMDTQIYILISSSILFLLSEVLPFVKSIHGNSILEIFVNFIKQLSKRSDINSSLLESTETTEEETRPLINSDIKHLNLLIEKLLDRLDVEEYTDRSLYLSSIDGQHIYVDK